MRVVNLDLDNTLIYSYKHDIGSEKIAVERYQGREISYITEKTYRLLKQIKEQFLVVPTTTRTKEQYDRIDLKAGAFPYALVCNGGVLLVKGERDEAWYRVSKELASEGMRELYKARGLLEKEALRKFEIRLIDDLFLFTKCSDSPAAAVKLRRELDGKSVDVFCNGEKLYVIPKQLNKGTAVRRFREYIKAAEVIAVGDSEFDAPMADAADIGIVPAGFCKKYSPAGEPREMKGEGIFSDEMLSWIMEYGLRTNR